MRINIAVSVLLLGYILKRTLPREIISTAGKTGHDARWKRKQS